jgi:Domain of unknown function (DUF5122) beta-propeller
MAPSGLPELVRYNANGTLDTAFGKHVALGLLEGQPTAMLVQKDGKVLMAGPTAWVRGRSGLVAAPSSCSGQAVASTRASAQTRDRDARRFMGDTLALQTDTKKIVVGGLSSNAGELTRLIGGSNCIAPDLRGATVRRARARWQPRTAIAAGSGRASRPRFPAGG